MRTAVKRKLKTRKGTTLVETLATVILLGLMGVALVAGIGAVQKAYGKVVRKANEQVLLSTTLTEMRDMLRHTQDYVKKDNVWYFQSETGYWFSFYNSKNAEGKNEGIAVKYYYQEKDAEGNMVFKEDGDSGKVYYLVPVSNGDVSGVYSSIEDDTFSAEDGTPAIITISNLKVGNDTDEIVLEPYKVAIFRKNGGA